MSLANARRNLVLGGEGLIGSTLMSALRETGEAAESWDLKTGRDLRVDGLEEIARFDRVWFLAWDTGGARYLSDAGGQHRMFLNNTRIAERVFDTLARSRTPFLFATSQLAGQPTAYGVTKLLGEAWAAQLGGKVARLWNVYGWEVPGVRSHVVTDLVLSGLREGGVQCMTDGQERRRLLYRTDCVEALRALFDGSLAGADIAGGEWLTIRQVASEVAAQLGVLVRWGTARGREVMRDPERPLPRWSPRVSLAEGIGRVIDEARAFLREKRAAGA